MSQAFIADFGLISDKYLADSILKKPMFFPELSSAQLLNVPPPDSNQRSVTFILLEADCVRS